MESTTTLNVDPAVLKTFLFYAAILIGKVLIMSTLTGLRRFKHRVFISPEDCVQRNSTLGTNEEVERVRRAHLNDLENIPFFLFAGSAYMMTEPSVVVAANLFRTYALFRIVHSIVYAIYIVPQPARALAYLVASLINWYMVIACAIKFYSYM